MACLHFLLILLCFVVSSNASHYMYVQGQDYVPDEAWAARIYDTNAVNNTDEQINMRYIYEWAVKLEKDTPALRGCLTKEDNRFDLFYLTKRLSRDGSAASPIKVTLKFVFELGKEGEYEIPVIVAIDEIDNTEIWTNGVQFVDDGLYGCLSDPGLNTKDNMRCVKLYTIPISPKQPEKDLSVGLIKVGTIECLPFVLSVSFDKGEVAYLHRRWDGVAFPYVPEDDDPFESSTTEISDATDEDESSTEEAIVDAEKKKNDSSTIILYIVIGVVLALILLILLGIIVYLIFGKVKEKKPAPPVKKRRSKKKKSEPPPVVQTIKISSNKPRKKASKAPEKPSKQKPPKVKTIRPPVKSPKKSKTQSNQSSTNLASDFLSTPNKPHPSSSNANLSIPEKGSGVSIQSDMPGPQEPGKKVNHVSPRPPSPANVKSDHTLLKSASAIHPPKTPSKKNQKAKKEKTEDGAETVATEETVEQKPSEGESKKSEKTDAKAKPKKTETEAATKKTTGNNEPTKKSEKSTKKSAKEKSSKTTPSDSSAKDDKSSS